MVSWEKRSPAKQLSENTSNGPDIEGLCVVGSVEDDFRGTVPTGDDVLGQGLLGREGRISEGVQVDGAGLIDYE